MVKWHKWKYGPNTATAGQFFKILISLKKLVLYYFGITLVYILVLLCIEKLFNWLIHFNFIKTNLYKEEDASNMFISVYKEMHIKFNQIAKSMKF